MNGSARLQALFDTRHDTKKSFVMITHQFNIRNDVAKDGKALVFLIVRSGKNQKTMNTGVRVQPKFWDKNKKRIKKSENYENLNAILDTIESKIVSTKTQFMVSERFLTPEIVIDVLTNQTPAYDFNAFCSFHLEHSAFKKNTIKQHKTALKKLREYKSEIPFHTIDVNFIVRYRTYLLKKKGNTDPTCFTDMKVIRKYLRLAKRQGIQMPIQLPDISTPAPNKTPVYLMPDEVKAMIKYFKSEFINPNHRLPLAYFLFACFTGMRISDIQKLSREQVEQAYFQFTSEKTGKFQSMKITEQLREILDGCPELFVKGLSDQKINKNLKVIAATCKIEKRVSMHVGRHTFATTYARNNGSALMLQQLLGHSKLATTARYVHLQQTENVDSVDIVKY